MLAHTLSRPGPAVCTREAGDGNTGTHLRGPVWASGCQAWMAGFAGSAQAMQSVRPTTHRANWRHVCPHGVATPSLCRLREAGGWQANSRSLPDRKLGPLPLYRGPMGRLHSQGPAAPSPLCPCSPALQSPWGGRIGVALETDVTRFPFHSSLQSGHWGVGFFLCNSNLGLREALPPRAPPLSGGRQ